MRIGEIWGKLRREERARQLLKEAKRIEKSSSKFEEESASCSSRLSHVWSRVRILIVLSIHFMLQRVCGVACSNFNSIEYSFYALACVGA